MVPRSLWLALFVTLAWAGLGQACQVPVFRYVLERWRPETYQVLVYHRGPLAEPAQAALKILREGSIDDTGKGNYGVELVEVNEPGNQAKYPPCPSSAVLPCMTVYYPSRDASWLPAWSGQLTADNVRLFQDSPLRQQLARQLQQGLTAVWVLVECGQRERDEQAARSLTELLQKLEKTLELPRDPDADPKEQPNLRIAFSVLRVSRQDRGEMLLRDLVLNADRNYPDQELLLTLGAMGRGQTLGLMPGLGMAATVLSTALDRRIPNQIQPLAFAIFGRGRVLGPIPGTLIGEETVGEIARFLISSCSCEIKDNMPGFDLMISSDWEIQPLEESTGPPPLPSLGQVAAASASPPQPEQVTEEPVAAPAALAAQPSQLYRNLVLAGGGALFLVVAVTLSIVVIRRNSAGS